MGGVHHFYGGSEGYGFDEPYEDPLFQNVGYRLPASAFGMATDPRTANQLKAVADKLSTGTKIVELSPVQANVLEAIPDQHLEELNRLKKLAGAELTLHGPLVEPTGISREGWDEAKRLQAERQMWSAVERGNKLDPKGNLVVTFHSSAALPEMIQRVKTKEGEEVTELWVMDEHEGKFASIKPRKDYLNNENPNPKRELEKLNKENWERRLSQASFHAYQGQDLLERAALRLREENAPTEITQKDILQLYKESRTSEGKKALNKLSPEVQKFAQHIFNEINHGEVDVRDAYNELKNLFNEAYAVAERTKNNEEIKKLNSYREDIAPKIKQEHLNDPEKLAELAEEVTKGIKLLSSIKPPEVYRPLNDFAIDKASDTFSGVAWKAYEKFGNNAPIISIENPPAGSGLSRGEDLKKLVEEAQKKFAQRAHKELGISEAEAERIAQKQIGVTWDVGHINMLRKYGFGDKELVKETEKVAKHIKHVHLSDNFGMEHTELPMGMGNVPTKAHMELIEQYNKKVKKIIETGDWYQHFKHSPLSETLAAFGSPIYGMKMAPYWNAARSSFGGYFAGYGLNPDIHHSIYGSGFANLPVELGGQMGGKNRLSGAPME